FGKRIGGDIIENKKTYLFLKALELAPSEEAQQLRDLYTVNLADAQQKVDTVTAIFEEVGVAQSTNDKIKAYTQEAFDLLNNIPIEEEKKLVFKEFGEKLMTRHN